MNTLTCNLPQWTLINTLQPLDGSIVHQCTSNHKIQPLMAPTCINASLHTQNALNQLKSSALWIECAQIHLNDSNEDLQCWNVHTCKSNALKYLQRAPIQHLCTSKLQMASKTSKLFKTPPRLQKRLQQCKLAPPTHTNPRDLSQCT